MANYGDTGGGEGSESKETEHHMEFEQVGGGRGMTKIKHDRLTVLPHSTPLR